MAKLDGNKLRSPRPDEQMGSSVEEAVKLGHNQFVDENGVVQKMRYKSRATPINGLKYELESLSARNANRGSDARRASVNQQSITLDDYKDFAKRNGYPESLAVDLYNENQAKLKELRGGKSKLINYEHLLPSRSPLRGGLEHYRNIVLMAAQQNAIKSDYLASITAAVKAGVPLTKSAAIKADFEGKALPSDQLRIKTILDDIANQPSPKTTRDVRKALSQNPLVESIGEKFQLSTTGGSIRLNRAALTGLAAAGVAALGPLGTAASAAEFQGRSKLAEETGNMMDQLQAGLAGTSLAADVASYIPPAAPIGEAVSTAADVANIGIDVYRQNPERAKQFAKQQIQRVAEPIVKPIQTAQRLIESPEEFAKNELKYVAGQIRLGRIPYMR